MLLELELKDAEQYTVGMPTEIQPSPLISGILTVYGDH